MLKHIYIIANPKAGSGDGANILKQTQEYLNSLHIPFVTYISEYPTHTMELTERIIHRGHSPSDLKIVVIGGDGTLHEVLLILMRANYKVPVHYLPAGTGNDFNRTWQKSLSAAELMTQIPYHVNPTEIPIFKLENKGDKLDNIAINSLGFGLDGQVIDEMTRINPDSFIKRFRKGKYSYLISTLFSVLSLPNFSLSLEFNGQSHELSDCQFVCFMNSPYLGNGIKLLNEHNHDIDIVIFQKVNPLSLIKILWQILVLKKKSSSSKFKHFQTNRLTYRLNKNVPSQVDGELRRIPNGDSATITINHYPIILP